MKPKKILILVKSLDGGTGTFVRDFLELAKNKNKNGYELKILALEKPKYRKVKIDPDHIFDNGNYYPESYSFSFRNIKKLGKELFFLRQKINTFNPDIVMTIDSYSLFLLGIAKYLWKLKSNTISAVHNNLTAVIQTKIPIPLRYITKLVMGKLLSGSDKVICVSKGLSLNIKRTFNLDRKPEFIYHGIKISKKNKPYPHKTSAGKIITIARFTKQKDFPTLLEAFSLSQKQFPDIRLTIVGDGPEKEKIIKLIRDRELENFVNLTDWVQKPGLFLDNSDIFVLSSNWEGFGYVLLEAMARGLPVISTNTPYGPSEILGSGKYGILVPKNNPTQMAKAILKLLKSKKSRYAYARKSLQRVSDFSLSLMLKKYKKIIDAV